MEPADFATPTALAARVREVDAARRRADLELLILAAAWADAHPLGELEERLRSGRVELADLDGLGCEQRPFEEDRGIPGVHPRAAGALGTLLGHSTQSADHLIRQALIVRHRLPRVWGLVLDGGIEAFRAKRLADAVTGEPDDICQHVDVHVASVAPAIGPVQLHRLLEEAHLRLHPETVELDQLERLDQRHVTIDEQSINHTGVADLQARADWADLAAFDEAVAAVAAALADQDAAAELPADSLDVRRSRALGVLADPEAALALLTGRPAPRPKRRTDLVLHIDPEALDNLSLLARQQALGLPVLAEAVRAWCGRGDRDLHVHPVIDLNQHAQTDAYEIAGRLRDQVELISPTCVFPWCTRPARQCDCDHRVPWDQGGASCRCNLSPLCRRHHNLKTHEGYRLELVELGTYLWTTPLGLSLLRDPVGTRDVTPDRPSARPRWQPDDPHTRGCLRADRPRVTRAEDAPPAPPAPTAPAQQRRPATH